MWNLFFIFLKIKKLKLFRILKIENTKLKNKKTKLKFYFIIIKAKKII